MSQWLQFPTPPRLFSIFLKAPNRLGIKAPTVAVCLYSAASTAAVNSALTLSALLFALLDLLSKVLVQMSPMGESCFFSIFFLRKTSKATSTVEVLSGGRLTWRGYGAAGSGSAARWPSAKQPWKHNKAKSIDCLSVRRNESCHSSNGCCFFHFF